MQGILISESIVLNDTILTEREVFAENLEANIVVIAAVGALQEIVEETSISPLIPHRYITPSAINGNTKSFKQIAKRHLKLFKPESKLLLVRW